MAIIRLLFDVCNYQFGGCHGWDRSFVPIHGEMGLFSGTGTGVYTSMTLLCYGRSAKAGARSSSYRQLNGQTS